MENNIKRFLGYIKDNEFYKEKIYNAKDAMEMCHIDTMHDAYVFNLAAKRIGILQTYNEFLIKLDEEDIEYFVKKYESKLEEEMNIKINEIKKEYGRQ